MRNQRGFTLIELMIVMAVITIMVGVLLPSFRGMREEGYVTSSKGDLRTLQTAIESYYIHNSNAYPANLAALTSALPLIVSAVPNDPFSGAAYGYGVSSGNDYYVSWSVGPGANGSAAISDAGVVTETNGSSCIYVSNNAIDSQP